ncbi:MAG: ABC transporter substrate-binding protein [Luteibaculaceae bacterium]
MNATLALDWTVNTNHSGFIVAQELGYYKSVGLNLAIANPADDNYATTPAKKVELGTAEFAICPTESIISYRTKSNPFQLKAIATIFQEDISAIVTLKNSGISRPSLLAGRTYASYRAKYEDAIINKMLEADGSADKLNISYPHKLGIWNTLLSGEADATWIFDNWEGVEADQKGVALHKFRLADFGIPYSYSPVIVASEPFCKTNKVLIKHFLEASKKGFLFAQQNPEITVEILSKKVPQESASYAFLLASQRYSNQYYGNENTWGKMNPKVINDFLLWLHNNGLEERVFEAADIAEFNLI